MDCLDDWRKLLLEDLKAHWVPFLKILVRLNLHYLVRILNRRHRWWCIFLLSWENDILSKSLKLNPLRSFHSQKLLNDRFIFLHVITILLLVKCHSQFVGQDHLMDIFNFPFSAEMLRVSIDDLNTLPHVFLEFIFLQERHRVFLNEAKLVWNLNNV